MDTNKITEELKEKIICINRVCKTVKGGRIFSIRVLCAVGNQNGKIGLGTGKAKEVPLAIEKAKNNAKRNIISINFKNTTINHPIKSYYTATCVYMLPALPGTGLIANSSIRAILEMVGIKNILTKTYGSTNPVNVAKAVFFGLSNMKTYKMIAQKRSKNIFYKFNSNNKKS